MARKEDEDTPRAHRSKGDDGAVAVEPGVASVAPTAEEQKAWHEEHERLKEEVGDYEKKLQDEQVERLRASGTLPPVVNPDSKLPHMVHERHGQIAPPNQNPTARCTVCGDPLAYGQNFVCVKHVRAG